MFVNDAFRTWLHATHHPCLTCWVPPAERRAVSFVRAARYRGRGIDDVLGEPV
jgi:hypothetical protein